MTTINDLENSKTKCPLCSSTIVELDLGKSGMTKEQLQILKRHIKQETFGLVVQLVDITMRKLDPDKMGLESEMKKAVNMIYQAIGEVNQKLSGTAVGKVGEMITIKDLKGVFHTDEFSDEKANKQGTDVIATVIENKESIGKIAISIKYDLSWKGDFIQQLNKNMKQEETNFGILVTKVFPKEALSDKAYVKESRSGGMMLIVKPEYVSVAYYGFRQALLAWERANRVIKNAEEQINEHQRISKLVIDWINGGKFAGVVKGIDEANKLSEETDKDAENLLRNVEHKIEHIRSLQHDLRSQLAVAHGAIQELKDLLTNVQKNT